MIPDIRSEAVVGEEKSLIAPETLSPLSISLGDLSNKFEVRECAIRIHSTCIDIEQNIILNNAGTVYDQLLVPKGAVISRHELFSVHSKLKFVWEFQLGCCGSCACLIEASEVGATVLVDVGVNLRHPAAHRKRSALVGID